MSSLLWLHYVKFEKRDEWLRYNNRYRKPKPNPKTIETPNPPKTKSDPKIPDQNYPKPKSFGVGTCL
jgi:hypothetical protein